MSPKKPHNGCSINWNTLPEGGIYLNDCPYCGNIEEHKMATVQTDQGEKDIVICGNCEEKFRECHYSK